jgi:hypothetical protein
MATAGITITAEIAELRELQTAIGRILEPPEKARIIEEALKKALAPALERLKQNTPEGPTGNLKRAASVKIVRYSKDGNAVGLLGYKRAGKGASESAQGGRVRKGSDRAFHQFWLEQGTKDTVIDKLSNTPYARKSHTRRNRSGSVTTVRAHQVSGQNAYYASSFNKLGPFKIQPTARPPRGEEGQRVQTTPGYPQAFFRRSATPITIKGLRAGGILGQPPLKTTWDQTSTTVAEILQRELRISLERALSTLTRSATGTL